MNRKSKKLVFNICVGALMVFGIVWIFSKFIHLGSVEFTDNAQVKQHIVPVNSRVQGFIKSIHFNEYQEVKRGDTLVVIDDAEFRFRLAQAEADYQNALSGNSAMSNSISTISNNIAVSDAGINEAKVIMDNAEREYIRFKNLYEKEAVTKQQFDGVKTAYDASKARYEMLVRQKRSTALVKSEQEQRLNQTQAVIELAKAAVELAKLNLSYTVIVAPCDGVVGRKSIQEGQLIQPGQTMVSVVDANEKWVVANYKETQTANITEGCAVEIEVDAVPGKVYKGFVKSISGATGASFSLMPQDNSSGNFVKVEQRIPVRIEFSNENSAQDMALLRAGMNVECVVNY